MGLLFAEGKKDFVRVVYLQRWFTSFLIIL